MHPDQLSSARPPQRGDGLGQLAAGAQLVGMVGLWLAVLPAIPLYAGGVWAGRAVKQRLIQRT
ncbi:MAG: hypothetical protein CMJ17_13990 [Phenylobacterium sp.]|jgi:hypothetical protein|nr:hypothetical protein [Phenylobacterium sp.]